MSDIEVTSRRGFIELGARISAGLILPKLFVPGGISVSAGKDKELNREIDIIKDNNRLYGKASAPDDNAAKALITATAAFIYCRDQEISQKPRPWPMSRKKKETNSTINTTL